MKKIFLTAVPAVMGQKAGYMLDSLPAHDRAL